MIPDEESYFSKTNSAINGNDNFFSDNIDFAPAKVKFRKHKYEKKLLVWISMSPRGISEPFIMASGNEVDQFVDLDSSLLLPFIKTNHSDGNYIFWPDQAGCHYAEHSLDFLCENLIHHVDKGDNPANCLKSDL